MAGRLQDRVCWSLLGVSAAGVLATARVLVPHASGFGTHRALGLPPCPFLHFFGIPCPTCGLTSSFAQLARFELTASLHAHALGLPFFALTVAICGASLYGFWRDLPFAQATRAVWNAQHIVRVTLLLCLAWAGRLLAIALG